MCDMSGSVSASMNYLTLQTPSKKSRRNKDDSQPGKPTQNIWRMNFVLLQFFSVNISVITAKICLVGRVQDVEGVQEAAEVTFLFVILI